MVSTISFGRSPDALTLRVHGRARADAESYWDANWLRCTADVTIGAFRGSLEWQLRNEDLLRFSRALEALDMKPGQALLDTGDGWLDVRVIRDEQGNVEARGQLVDNPNGGNSLEFHLPLDQTALSTLRAQLRAVLERYPIVGKEAS